MFYARFFSHFLFEEGQVRVPEPFSLQLALGTVHSDCYQVAATGKYLPKNKVKIQGQYISLSPLSSDNGWEQCRISLLGYSGQYLTPII